MKKLLASLLLSITIFNTGCNEIISHAASNTYTESSTTAKSHTKKLKLKTSNVPSIDIKSDTNFTYSYGSAFGTRCDVYDFDDHITLGAIENKSLASASPRNIYFEGYYGVTAYTEDNVLYVKGYDNTSLQNISNVELVTDVDCRSKINVGMDRYTSIDCTNFANGLYDIVTTFNSTEVNLYFYVNDSKVYVCKHAFNSGFSAKAIYKRRDTISKLTKEANITPENSLDNSQMVYPCIESKGHRCDTDRWIQLSNDLLKDYPNASDEFKIFIYSQWFMDNIKYDYYRLNVLKHSRALTYNQWDGRYSMYDLKVGVCCDFTNVMTIMLRAQGIPASSVTNDTHMWNIVYIDGAWRELDLTSLIYRGSYEADASDCVLKSINYNDYLTDALSSRIDAVGKELYTYDFFN